MTILEPYYVCFNTEDEVFSDPNIRKAFSLVIDRNYIVENVSQAGEVPADGYVPNGVNDAAGAGSDDFRTVGGSYYSISDEVMRLTAKRPVSFLQTLVIRTAKASRL